jgi:hypothetical protein
MATITEIETIHDTDALLVAPSGKHLVQFRNVGSNQAWTAQYQLIDGQWVMRSSGFNWIGILHDRYRSFKAKGYRKP